MTFSLPAARLADMAATCDWIWLVRLIKSVFPGCKLANAALIKVLVLGDEAIDSEGAAHLGTAPSHDPRGKRFIAHDTENGLAAISAGL